MVQEGTVDILGIVYSLSDITDVKLKSGQTKPKWTIDILDNSKESGISIQMTIWGDSCTQF